jgi:uncharacterized integral membrane protein (TIGR00698 family)
MVAAVISIVVTNLVRLPPRYASGLQFSTRWLLKVGIILYGLNFSYALWFRPGAEWILAIGLVTVFVPILTGYFIGRIFGLDRHSTILVAVGTGVCGISAVVATQQALRSDDEKAGMALATILVFGTLVLFTYPILSGLLHLSTFAYGVWTGATTLDLPQLVAAALQGGGNGALTPALWVKSIRIGLLVPVILVLIPLFSNKNARGLSPVESGYRRGIRSFPLFILVFFAAIFYNTVFPIPGSIAAPVATGKGIFLGLNLANIVLTSAIIGICFRVRHDVVGRASWKVVVLGGLIWGLQSLLVLTLLAYLPKLSV